ncbi:tRNA (N6-isopentenyl adenosine(37)-C2)-methylthiotransferase MiaB [soil metagenome]
MTGLVQKGALGLMERPRTRKGTYFIQTWGCQMNEEDSEQMALHLRDLGYEPTGSIHEAQVILLNTCSVRKKPEDKAFSLMGELIPTKRARPDTIIGVCGCMAQARADEIHRRAPHIDFVLGTGDLGLLPGLVEEAAQKKRFQMRTDLPERKGRVVTDVPQRHIERAPKLKAFVPIQYGCDKFCTYCIVPTTRGRERSRPTEDILEECRRLAETGTKEVTLLGQTVNSYGKNLLEGRVPFSELLWRIADVSGIERIRYTSPYPRDFRDDLIEAIRDCPKVMEHVHLPLQSGDDEVLQRMKRVYTLESYLEIVGRLRSMVPGIGITTDVIVGFPGESEAQFEATVAAFERVRFDGAYMFAYSIRPDTPAGDDPDQLPEIDKKRRLNALIEVQNRITQERNEAQIGRVAEVLVEGPSPKDATRLQGYTRDFRMVHFPGSADRSGRLAQVRLDKAHRWGLSGEAV